MENMFSTLAIFFVVFMMMTSLVLTEHPSTESDHVYDRACYVPPDERPRDENKILLVDPSYPGKDRYKRTIIRVFPNGTCGLDAYYYNPDMWFDPNFISVIRTAEKSIFAKYCTYERGNITSQPWEFTMLTTGDSKHYKSVKLVPDEELSQLPPYWVDGCIFRAHSDFVAVGQHTIMCSLPLMDPAPDSNYNINISIQINGCPSGRYGSLCDKHCACVDGVECHSFNGACMCPSGLTGTHCEHTVPRLSVHHQEVYIPYGTTYNLTCIAEGMVLTGYSWIKNGSSTPMVTASMEETVPYTPRPVVITTTVEANDTTVNGGYICEVNDANGTVYRQYATVNVIAVPDPFTQVPQNQTSLIDRNVIFICKTKKVAGTIKWVKGHTPPSMEIKDVVGRYGILYPSAGVSQLHIYGVEFTDEDVYRCYVGYTFKEPDLNYAEAMLVVQSDPIPTCSFQDVVDAQSGQEVTLHCQMKAIKPKPSITWFIKGREVIPEPTTITTVSDDQYSFDVNTSLTFVPFPVDDGRIVSVAMTSPAWKGIREMSASLNVAYKPILTITPDPISLASGQDASISCAAEGNPDPSSYIWILRQPDKPPRKVSSSSGIYHLKSVDMTYNKATLTCNAGNLIGDTKLTVQMEVTENGFPTAASTAFSVSGAMCLVVLVLLSSFAYRFRKEILLWWSSKTGKNKNDKEFDVFISYKSGTLDEEFVIQDLIPRLEQDGYRVCVHYRFFMPGRSIIDNISDAVRRSRKTLLLLSPAFVESEWCRYEFQAALLQMLRRQMDIIPVIFEDLGHLENLSEDLQTVLRTLSYITWPDAVLNGRCPQKEVDQEQFWKLLKESLPEVPLGLEEQVPDTQPEEEDHDIEEDDADMGDRVLMIPV